MSSYGRSRPRGPADLEGCLVEIGKVMLGFFMFASVVGAVVWYLSPDVACSRYDEIKVMEWKTVGWTNVQELVTKKVCAEWKVVEP